MRNIIRKRDLLTVLVLAVAILIMNVNPLMVNAAVYKVSSDVEKYKVNYLIKDYQIEESEHFIYRYTEEDKEVLELVEKNAEDSYNNLSPVFGNIAKNKITIIIFPSNDSMNMALGLPYNAKVMGLYNCGFISVLSPNVWINEENTQFEQIFEKTGPVLHELTHYFVDIKSNGNYPAWFTEGVALYFEKDINGTEWGKGINYQMKPYTIEELTNNFEELNQEYAYRRSLEIVSDYVDKYGIDNLMQSMEKLQKGYPLLDFGN